MFKKQPAGLNEFNYKIIKSFEERKIEAEKVRKQYTDRVPAIIEKLRNKFLPHITCTKKKKVFISREKTQYRKSKRQINV